MGRLAIIVVLLVASCHDDGYELHCAAPATIDYMCEPVAADAYGCVGGPVWQSLHTGIEHREDPDKVFPVSCYARLPECGCCYEAGRLVQCIGNDDAGTDGTLQPAAWGELP